jgi:hypothetical protein
LSVSALDRFRVSLNRENDPISCFDALSQREPVPASLENATVRHGSSHAQIRERGSTNLEVRRFDGPTLAIDKPDGGHLM